MSDPSNSDERRPGLAERIRIDLWRRPAGSFAPLDGLRGLASLMVIFYHCAAFSPCSRC